jgi:hypothetical protein
VIETLVAVCSDPSEHAFVWTEALEALGYIWEDIGPPTQATLECLTPSARSQIVNHLEIAADPSAAQRIRDRNHWLSRLKEMPDSEVLLFYERAVADEQKSHSTFARNDFHRMRVAAELQLRKRGLPLPSPRS